MKFILLFPLLSFCIGDIVGQDCTPWFPFNEDTRFEYSFFDKKDRLTGRMEYHIANVTQTGADYRADVTSKFFDKKDKEAGTFEFEVSCSDGVYRANVSNFMNPAVKEMFGNVEVSVTGEDLVIPPNLKVGEKLPDANSHMEAEMGIITMKMDMEITNREVLGKETVVTPAGSFEAFKVTAQEHIKMPVMNRTSTGIYFYAPGYGQVKYEYFDKKGNLDSYMLLTKFDRP
ncbi:MAG: hypothetical protein HKN76_07415 [Saprospiraceae bacterium]|nr:hypothetical protein [Saprospiraceae bacterium]